MQKHKKKIIKYALLMVVFFIVFDWFLLSGREIDGIDRIEQADGASVYYSYRIVTALDKSGYPAEHSLERDAYVLNAEQIGQVKALIKDTRAHWCFRQSMVSSSFDNTVPLGAIDHSVDSYDIRAFWKTGEDMQITVDYGRFLHYNGTTYKIIGKDFNTRMMEILGTD